MQESAMPISSAHALVWPRPVPPTTLRNSIKNGPSAMLKSRPDAGHPCMIPAVMKGGGTFSTSNTSASQRWHRLGNAWPKSNPTTSGSDA
eukprot:1502467-Pyramimonas_sp.AAC.1